MLARWPLVSFQYDLYIYFIFFGLGKTVFYHYLGEGASTEYTIIRALPPFIFLRILVKARKTRTVTSYPPPPPHTHTFFSSKFLGKLVKNNPYLGRLLVDYRRHPFSFFFFPLENSLPEEEKKSPLSQENGNKAHAASLYKWGRDALSYQRRIQDLW